MTQGSAEQQSSPGQDDFEKSVDQMRATGKWILVAFAAVGTALAAGSQLSSIGRLDLANWPHLLLAVIAVVVVLGAIGVAIWLVVRVESAGEVSLGSLDARDIEFVQNNPPLLAGYPSVDRLRRDYYYFVKQLYEKSHERNPEALTQAGGWVAYLSPIVAQLLSAVRYNRVKRTFDQSVPIVFGTSLAAGLAIAVFAWAANPTASTTAEAPLFRTPTEAYVRLTTQAKSQLSDSIGGSCVKQPIPVVVLSMTSSMSDVVSLPTDKCQVFRFTVSDQVGTLLPADAVNVSPSTKGQ
jgi:hypothetical protein